MGECILLVEGEEVASAPGTGVEEETTRFPREQYGEWRLEHPESWNELPWAG